MKTKNLYIPLFLASLLLFPACKKKEITGKVWLSQPLDKSEVVSPVKFVMHVEGMAIHPAGELKDGTGHFHILVNKEAIKAGEVVITDAEHIHYGKGQTEDTLDLKPGDYHITLQFADGAHVSYGPAWAQTITLKVKTPAKK